MKKNLFLLVSLFSFLSYGQVGLNTDSPESTLDVRAKNHLGVVTGTDGVLVPRVNGLTNVGTINGQLVYLITDSGAFKKGFHYWDGTSWNPILNGNTGTNEVFVRDFANINPQVKIENESDGVTIRPAGTEFIVQDDGKVGIGLSSPQFQLDILGNFHQTNTLSDGRINRIESGDNLLGIGVKGIGILSQKSGDLGYIMNVDATSVGGFSTQVGTGITNFADKNTRLISAIDTSTGEYHSVIDNSDGISSASTDWSASTIKNNLSNGSNQHSFIINVTELSSNMYRSIRDDTSSTTPVNFLYTDSNGKFLSSPLTLLDRTNDAFVNSGTNVLLATQADGVTSRPAGTEFIIQDDGKTGIGTIPLEKLDVAGAVKISTDNTYTITADGQTTPVPNGGAGTIIFNEGHFFGWTGNAWKQLDN